MGIKLLRLLNDLPEPKLDIVRGDGADAAIDYTKSDFEAEVMRLTGNKGVDVVYDSVGKTTFDKSLDSLALRGMLVLFGQSSGSVSPIDPSRLAKKGTFLTRPTLQHYTATRDELMWRARELSGVVRVRIDRELPLRDAAEAHRRSEERVSFGMVIACSRLLR